MNPYIGIIFVSIVLLQRCATGLLVANTAIEPIPRDDSWMMRHESMVERAKAGDIDLLFLGDSITDYWNKRALEVWQDAFGQYRTANFGISADRTQHLLWRLENGEGEGFQPKVVVLLIGTNNTGWEKDKITPRNSVDEVIEGVEKVVAEVRARFPDATLLLFGLFPRAAKDHPQRTQVRQVNERLRLLHDCHRVCYFDIGDGFLDDHGDIIEELMPDLLHPSAGGYRIWAEALKKPLEYLLKSEESEQR